MDFLYINIVLLVVGALAFVIALKLLIKPGWFKGFIRGCLGFSLIALTVVLGSSSLHLSDFTFAYPSDILATISVKKVSTQVYSVTIKPVNASKEIKVKVVGDMFQISTDKVFLPFLGDRSLFQLTHLKTKYYALEQQESKRISNFSLKKDSYPINVWDMLAAFGFNQVAQPKATPFYAMIGGEVLSLSLFHGGLLLKPIDTPPTS